MDAYDRISSLPDEILFHIISSLAFESSIQTIFLSKRWRFLWDTTLVQHGSSKEVASAISTFLANFNGQDPSKCTRKFKFHFSNSGSFLVAIIASNDKLFLDFSSPPNHMSNKLFNLEIEFNLKNPRTDVREDLSTYWSPENAEGHHEYYVQSFNCLCKSTHESSECTPNTSLSEFCIGHTRKSTYYTPSTSASELSIFHCQNSSECSPNIPVSESWIRHCMLPQKTSSLFIKNLHLTSLTCLTNEAASSILTTFHFLETLKISNCNSLQSLFVGSDTKLQSLTIFDCLKLEFVHIRCFKLQTFRYRGNSPCFWPEYHFNLVDAFLDLRLGPVKNSLISGCNFDLMLLTIKNVRVLTLCKWTFQGLICKSLSRIEAEFQFYNLKELWWIDNEYDSDALFCFLKLCPFLEQLFVTIDPKSYSLEKTNIEVSCCSIKAGRNTKLGNLKLVILQGFTNQKDEFHLAQSLGEIVTCEPIIIFASSNGLCLKKKSNSQHGHYFHAYVDFKEAKELCCTKHLHMGL